MIELPAVDLSAIIPEITITIVGMLVLAVDIFVRPRRQTSLAVISFIGLFITLLAVMAIWNRDDVAFGGMVAVDSYAQFFKMLFLLSAALTILISPRYLQMNNISFGEYFQLLLFCTLGMMVMAAATDLITIYIGIELMAISIYLLAGFQRESPRSAEASMKYYLLGAFASAILLYGMSFFYGLTGTTSLEGISEYLLSVQAADGIEETLNYRMITLAMVLMTVGFAFKIAAVPFHMWTPDVYEGAPTPLTAFMSVGPKVAGFAVIMRVYMTTFHVLIPDWTQLFWLLAVLTMIVGNVVAVAQQNIKRMLAYSSIAHAGYLLIGVVSAGSAAAYKEDPALAGILTMDAMMSVMVYLFAYMFMNIGAFAVVIALGRAGDPRESLRDYSGLAQRRPATALFMTILMLSLAGIPPTFGFIGKWYVFRAAIQTENVALAVIGVLASVVAAFYYIRVIVYMYMREPEMETLADREVAGSTMYAIVVTSIFTLLFGVAPGIVINMARNTIERMLT